MITKISEKIKPIREIIAFVILIVGLVVGSVTYFVTKDRFDGELLKVYNQLNSDISRLQCLLAANIHMLNLEDLENRHEIIKEKSMGILAAIAYKDKIEGKSKEYYKTEHEIRILLDDERKKIEGYRRKGDEALEKLRLDGCSDISI